MRRIRSAWGHRVRLVGPMRWRVLVNLIALPPAVLGLDQIRNGVVLVRRGVGGGGFVAFGASSGAGEGELAISGGAAARALRPLLRAEW